MYLFESMTTLASEHYLISYSVLTIYLLLTAFDTLSITFKYLAIMLLESGTLLSLSTERFTCRYFQYSNGQ